MAAKYKKIKELYTHMLKINAQKDIKIAALNSKLDKKQILIRKNQTSIDLTRYLEVFTEQQIEELEKIPSYIKNDATFVRKIVFHLYSETTEIGEIPTLNKGIKYNRCQLPEEIGNLIRAMYSVRIEKYAPNEQDYIRRLQRVNLHTSNALNYLVRKKI